MMTCFQGLPGQQPVPGTLDFPGSPQKLPSTSEVDSEASMSEASSEDLVPPLGRDEEETVKKKKPKVLANMFSVFTKGRKKKGQPSSSEPEGKTESQPRPEDRLPTGRMVPHVGRGPVRATQGAGQGWGSPSGWLAHPGHREGRSNGFGGGSPHSLRMHPLPNLGGRSRQTGLPSRLGHDWPLWAHHLAFSALSLLSCGRHGR